MEVHCAVNLVVEKRPLPPPYPLCVDRTPQRTLCTTYHHDGFSARSNRVSHRQVPFVLEMYTKQQVVSVWIQQGLGRRVLHSMVLTATFCFSQDRNPSPSPPASPVYLPPSGSSVYGGLLCYKVLTSSGLEKSQPIMHIMASCGSFSFFGGTGVWTQSLLGGTLSFEPHLRSILL